MGGAAFVPHYLPRSKGSICHIGGTQYWFVEQGIKVQMQPEAQKTLIHSISKYKKIRTSYFRKRNQEITQTQKSLKDQLVESPEFRDVEIEAHKMK